MAHNEHNFELTRANLCKRACFQDLDFWKWICMEHFFQIERFLKKEKAQTNEHKRMLNGSSRIFFPHLSGEGC